MNMYGTQHRTETPTCSLAVNDDGTQGQTNPKKKWCWVRYFVASKIRNEGLNVRATIEYTEETQTQKSAL